MAKRRGPGEHSVYQLPDKTWAASMEAGNTKTGKRKRIVRKAKTKRAALEKLEKAKRELHDAGAVPDQRTSVEAYLNWWLSDVVAGTVRESTLTGYQYIVKSHLIPNLGKVRLAQLGPEHVQAMMQTMDRDGLSPQTRRTARTVLSMALRRAQRFGMATRNAAAMVDPPKLNRVVVDDALAADEVRKVLALLHDRDDVLVAVAEVAIRLGLRQGELLALRWHDVDLEVGTLHVAGTMKRRKGGGWYVEEPKTRAGDRVVPLTDHLIAVLKAHRKRQAAAQLAGGPSWHDLGFVFTTSVGTPLEARNLTRWWHSIFAPILNDDGEPLPDDQQLGLADARFTRPAARPSR